MVIAKWVTLFTWLNITLRTEHWSRTIFAGNFPLVAKLTLNFAFACDFFHFTSSIFAQPYTIEGSRIRIKWRRQFYRNGPFSLAHSLTWKIMPRRATRLGWDVVMLRGSLSAPGWRVCVLTFPASLCAVVFLLLSGGGHWWALLQPHDHEPPIFSLARFKCLKPWTKSYQKI